MGVFDENKPITHEFLIENGFYMYRKGYYMRNYNYFDEKDPEERTFSIEVIYAMQNNNLYGESSNMGTRSFLEE